MIRDIEDKIDKVRLTGKEVNRIGKWYRDREFEMSSYFDEKMFFPLKTFIFELDGTKTLIELDDYNPVLSGRATTDRYWYTWKREHRDGRGGFLFEGQGIDKKGIHISHSLIIGTLTYICQADREKEYRVAVEQAKRNGCEPHQYSDRVCFLLKDIVQYVHTHQTKKSVKISCECWGVRGHIRHYQNGRTVFIEPYKKGKKRDVLEPRSKTYLLGGKNDNS